jgi:flagellar motor switch protein FliM
MTESVLSNEEVEALLKVSQDKYEDLDKVIGTVDSPVEKIKQNSHIISSINDLTRNALEKTLCTFFRSKVFVKSNCANVAKASESFTNEGNNNVFTAFRLSPQECYGLFNIDNFFIHQSINALYGGKVNKDDHIIEAPGKIGMIISEKLAELFLESFMQACSEYGTINYEILKTTTTLTLAFNFGLETQDNIYYLEYSILLNDVENKIKFALSDEFIDKFIANKNNNGKKQKKDFWRDAIKTQVVDSLVNLKVTLPDIQMQASDFMKLKEGDTIPIGDPTAVYICLNSYKLFRAVAGQTNSQLVVKVTEQI